MRRFDTHVEIIVLFSQINLMVAVNLKVKLIVALRICFR